MKIIEKLRHRFDFQSEIHVDLVYSRHRFILGNSIDNKQRSRRNRWSVQRFLRFVFDFRREVFLDDLKSNLKSAYQELEKAPSVVSSTRFRRFFSSNEQTI